MKHQKQGFTLIELLVVIAIIGILSSIGLVALANSQARARDAKRRADLNTLTRILAGEYLNSNTAFPLASVGNGVPAQAGPVWTGASGSSLEDASRNSAADLQFAIPASPRQGASGTIHDYWYITNDPGSVFAFFAKLETGSQQWFVVNSKGWANEISSSSALVALPDGTNSECEDTLGAVNFSPCLSDPYIQ